MQHWEELVQKSELYDGNAESLLEDDRYEGALEQVHIALEIMFKAVLERHGTDSHSAPDPKNPNLRIASKYPYTHNLDDLAACKFQPAGGKKQSLNRYIRSDKMAHRLWQDVRSNVVWEMHLRYKKLPFTQEEIAQAIDKYRRLRRWIATNCV